MIHGANRSRGAAVGLLFLLLAACGGGEEGADGGAGKGEIRGDAEATLGPGVTVDTQTFEDSSALIYLPSDSAAAR